MTLSNLNRQLARCDTRIFMSACSLGYKKCEISYSNENTKKCLRTWTTVGSAHMELQDRDIQAESSCKSPRDKFCWKIRHKETGVGEMKYLGWRLNDRNADSRFVHLFQFANNVAYAWPAFQRQSNAIECIHGYLLVKAWAYGINQWVHGIAQHDVASEWKGFFPPTSLTD